MTIMTNRERKVALEHMSITLGVETFAEGQFSIEVRQLRPGAVEIEIAQFGRDLREYVVVANHAAARDVTRDYWLELIDCDRRMFCDIVGMDSVVEWAFGNGSAEEWIDEACSYPEEHLAGHDGVALEAHASAKMIEALGFEPEIAYRRW